MQAPQRWCRDLSSTLPKYDAILSNMHKVGGTHFQCVNNDNVKFEYKGIKLVGVAGYTSQTPISILDGKMS